MRNLLPLRLIYWFICSTLYVFHLLFYHHTFTWTEAFPTWFWLQGCPWWRLSSTSWDSDNSLPVYPSHFNWMSSSPCFGSDPSNGFTLTCLDTLLTMLNLWNSVVGCPPMKPSFDLSGLCWSPLEPLGRWITCSQPWVLNSTLSHSGCIPLPFQVWMSVLLGPINWPGLTLFMKQRKRKKMFALFLNSFLLVFSMFYLQLEASQYFQEISSRTFHYVAVN